MKKLKPRVIVLIVVCSLVAFIVAAMCYGVYAAVQDAKNIQTTTAGGRTQGATNIQASKVKAADVEGEVNLPENSPQVVELRAAESAAMAAAKQNATPYVPKVRVNGESPNDNRSSDNVNNNGPKPNAVDERGNEVPKNGQLTSAGSGAKGSSDKENGNASNQANNGTFGENALREQELAQAQQIRDEELKNQLATAKQNRFEQERALKIKNAKALFSGLPYVPPVTNGLKFNAPSLGRDPYTRGTNELSFTEQVGDTVSALVRTDGGTTLFGQPHPNYLAKLDQQNQGQAESSPAENVSDNDRGLLLVEAGKMIYAHLTLPIDSDAPGPVRFQIDQGAMRGSTGFGAFRLLANSAGIGLQANAIIHNGEKLPINAWVLNPSTKLPNFDDDIDNHYLYRFSGLAAGGFLTGFIESLMPSETVASNGGSVISKGRIEDTKERIIYSLGTAAQGFMPVFYDMANRPVTVKIPNHQPIALLFMDEVYENPLAGESYFSDLAGMQEALKTESKSISKAENSPDRTEINPESDNKLALWQ